MSRQREVVAIHVWRDEPAAQQYGASRYYSVSEVDDAGEEIRCIGGGRDLSDAWTMGRDHAESLGVPCV